MSCDPQPPGGRPRGVCPFCEDPETPIMTEQYWPHFLVIVNADDDEPMVVMCTGSWTPIRRCRVCGCTELNCAQCFVKTGKPCSWVEDDLCSACVTEADLPALSLGEEPDLNGDVFPFDLLAEDLPEPRTLHRFGLDFEGATMPPVMGAALELYRNAPIDPTAEKIYVPGQITETLELQRAGGSLLDLAKEQFNDPRDFLQGLAELTGSPKLQELADAGGEAWATLLRREVTHEFESQYQQRPVDLTPEDKQKMKREAEENRQWREKRDRERGG